MPREVILRLAVLVQFASGVFLVLELLAHFELYQVFMCWIALNIFNIYFETKYLKISQDIHKDFWTTSILFVKKCLSTSKFYTNNALRALLSKNWFCFMQNFHHPLGCNAIGINPSLIFFYVAYLFQI